MEEENISQEKVEELMSLKGETRGVSIKGDLEYVLHKEGKEGLKKLEEKMAELGHPIKYQEIKDMGFYPVGLEALTLLLMKNLFGFDRKEFQKMGAFNSKVSLIVRLFMKYFISLESISKQASQFWEKYYTEGDLAVTEINKEEGYIVIQLKDYEHSELHCGTVEGYLISVISMVTGGGTVTSEERKCPHKGDEYHEFVVSWK
ncbi:MAG: hypothetical protein GF370_00635 [Candidatus Nealsonbacteria bacterium]|nr:hypothetical protein [Candidatus Nealsonbacteria bacterium]